MRYFTELIDRIWDEKGRTGRSGASTYTWKQILSLLVLMSVLSGIYYAGLGIWTLIKGFLADG